MTGKDEKDADLLVVKGEIVGIDQLELRDEKNILVRIAILKLKSDWHNYRVNIPCSVRAAQDFKLSDNVIITVRSDCE